MPLSPPPPPGYDPHSPYRYGTRLRGLPRGPLHARVGRPFGDRRHHFRRAEPTSACLLERPGRVHDVRRPSPARVAARRA
ncbi:hypothetical protein [Streptomyces sp. S.PB5]|uniref:hypothetical protein n=1 Tax=Streptomyces sp. S.PB5 TaxID=3020844 RepID=UPI0025B1F0ED|nr:hypothetical protein [Streptomyces sp. S.PB5]MDN3023516.1 hypothetical protein [Streptomyces sp. S.PB5]